MAHLSDSSIASQASEAPTEIRNMVSDGRRMRMVWCPGDGDGDSTPSIVFRYKNLVGGHPKWHIYVDNLQLPIIRGTPDEPPHYCYLDDRACYAIYRSEAYNTQEMREFWPWDFDYLGNVKRTRPNRGNPAYLDDSKTAFAQGKLTGTNKLYTFSGAPEVTERKPLGLKKDRQREVSVVQENSEDVDVGVPTNGNLNEFHRSLFSSTSPPSLEVQVSEASRSQLSIFQPRSPQEDRIITLPHSGSHNLINPVKLPSIPADLGAFGRKGTLAEENTKTTDEESLIINSPVKRKLEVATDPNSEPPKKRESRITSRFGSEEAKSTDERQRADHHKGYNIDDDNDYEIPVPASSFMSPSQTQLLQAKVKDLEYELETANAHSVTVSRERDAFRHVIVKLLAGKTFQQADLTNCIIALQTLFNQLTAFASDAQRIASSAKKRIEPTEALCDGIGTVLDGPGKYMYDRGMDEEWMDLQNEARKVVEKYS